MTRKELPLLNLCLFFSWSMSRQVERMCDLCVIIFQFNSKQENASRLCLLSCLTFMLCWTKMANYFQVQNKLQPPGFISFAVKTFSHQNLLLCFGQWVLVFQHALALSLSHHPVLSNLCCTKATCVGQRSKPWRENAFTD